MKKKVAVGISGGVDSSVAALLLKEQGYEVVGLFMNNWHEEEGGVCCAETDFADVRRVCGELDVPYYSVDFSKDYYERVFRHFVEEYKRGRTPNPDVLCNREIKFDVLKKQAQKLGCEYLATGHYCGSMEENGRVYLLRAKDENKCQTYFLNQVTEAQLRNVIFPLSELTKPEVRKLAEENRLVTASKKDSTGVCFIGERNFRKFLAQYLPMQKGDIKTLDGRIVGQHDGVFYYTVGQRKGFGLGGMKGESNDEPWFVVGKDVQNNVLYVNQGELPSMYSQELVAEAFNFITETMEKETRVLARIRHRQPLTTATAIPNSDGSVSVYFDNPQRAVCGGQYCVLYSAEKGEGFRQRICIGGGVIK